MEMVLIVAILLLWRHGTHSLSVGKAAILEGGISLIEPTFFNDKINFNERLAG